MAAAPEAHRWPAAYATPLDLPNFERNQAKLRLGYSF
jgi:hypothetical protein